MKPARPEAGYHLSSPDRRTDLRRDPVIFTIVAPLGVFQIAERRVTLFQGVGYSGGGRAPFGQDHRDPKQGLGPVDHFGLARRQRVPGTPDYQESRPPTKAPYI